MLYPFKFKDVYKDYLWGGRTLASLGKSLPSEGIVAESWEISAHPNGPSIVNNGFLSGLTLNRLLEEYPSELLGHFNTSPYTDKFPLLIKLIDACNDLSVQVHPNDEQAARLEHGELGKNEMWYILAAKEDSRLIIGTTPGTNRSNFAQAIESGTISNCLQEISVKPGDIVDIPAGLLHAIGKGIVICEIQQNSDTTYRVYDYDRIDANGNTRPLHVEKALEVIDFSLGDSALKKPITIHSESADSENTIELLLLNSYFKVERWRITTALYNRDSIERFHALTVLGGNGSIFWDNNGLENSLEICQGESILIPAIISNWRIEGELELLNSQLPHPSDRF